MLSTIFEKALSMAGFETEIISNGNIALTRLKETVPDLITLDLHLPKVSGEDILKAIKADERLDGAKIIITTADTRLGEFLSPQVDMVLLKPIRFSHLRNLAVEIREKIG